MANVFEGLTSGIERGFRLGALVEDQKRQQANDEYLRQKREQDLLLGEQRLQQGEQALKLSKHQMDVLLDEKKTKDLLLATNSTLYSLQRLLNDTEAQTKELQDDPKKAEALKKDIATVADTAFSDTGNAGKTKFEDLEATDQVDENGSPLFRVKIKNEKGKDTYITQNRKSLESGDTPRLFSVDEIGTSTTQLQQLAEQVDAEAKRNGGNRKKAIQTIINQTEAQQVGLGDTGPLERMRASGALSEQRLYDEGKAKKAHEYAMELANANRKPERLYNLGTREEPSWGTRDQALAAGIKNPYLSLSPQEKDALAIKDLEAERAVPEESTWLGFGKPKFSRQQIDAAVARRSMAGGIGGQSRPLTHDGYPARQNPDGTISTELSITVTDPRINNGKPTNIPSLWKGQQVDQDTAIVNAINSGQAYPAFNTIDEAVKAAEARSSAGGAAQGELGTFNNPLILDSGEKRWMKDGQFYGQMPGQEPYLLKNTQQGAATTAPASPANAIAPLKQRIADLKAQQKVTPEGIGRGAAQQGIEQSKINTDLKATENQLMLAQLQSTDKAEFQEGLTTLQTRIAQLEQSIAKRQKAGESTHTGLGRTNRPSELGREIEQLAYYNQLLANSTSSTVSK